MAKRQLTTSEFIEKAKKIHGEKYDYSNTKYEKTDLKVSIICPEHGEFWQTPHHHLNGIGCPKCSGWYKTTNEIIEQFKTIHGDKYDYSKVNYINSTTKVCIICPEHGEFWQKPSDHLSGYGCPHCRKLKFDTEKFIENSRNIHGDLYDYSLVNYTGCRNDVDIICKKHGVFKQKPFKHIQGQGCPICCSSNMEKKVLNILKVNKINFIHKCNKKHFNWLGKQHLDFYLPDYNIAIECQGEQHFYPIDFAGKGEKWSKESFEHIKKLDEEKNKKCVKNNIKLLYLTKNNLEEKLILWLNVSSLG